MAGPTEDALDLQRYLKSRPSAFRTLHELVCESRFTLSSKDSEDYEMAEEGKSDGEVAKAAESLQKSFQSVMLRFIQAIKSTGR